MYTKISMWIFKIFQVYIFVIFTILYFIKEFSKGEQQDLHFINFIC